MSKTQRIRAVLGLTKTNVPVLLAGAKTIHNAMGAAAAQFPSPNPPLATLQAQIQDLDTAEQATKTKTKGTVAIRDTKREILYSSLESERMYVQSLADANPEQAVAIVTAAGLGVGKTPSRTKPVLQVKPGPLPGTAKLVANASLLAGKRTSKSVTYNWQMSADGGKTWTNLPSTPLASTTVENLTALTTYMFRVSATVSKTVGAPSEAVTLLAR